MNWVELNGQIMLGNLPTDVRERYQQWMLAYPEKDGRLDAIVANTVAEFRDVIKSYESNTLDPRPSYLPQSTLRHAEAIIIFNLAMEMGMQISTSGNSSRVSADFFLRSIPFGRFKTGSTSPEGQVMLPSPRFTVPEQGKGLDRALPVILMFLIAATVEASWIRPGSTVYDTDIFTTATAQGYTNSANTLYAHLMGISSRFMNLDNLYLRIDLSNQVPSGPIDAATLDGLGSASFARSTNVVTLTGNPSSQFPPWIPAPQTIKGRINVEGLILGSESDPSTDAHIRPAHGGANVAITTPNRTGSPGDAGSIHLSPGRAVISGSDGKVIVNSDLEVSGLITGNGGGLTNVPFAYPLQFEHGAVNPVGGAVYYIGGISGLAPANTMDISRTLISHVEGQIRRVSIIHRINGALGSLEPSSYVVVNLSRGTQSVVDAIHQHQQASMAETYEVDPPVSVGIGDMITIQWFTPNWANPPTSVRHVLIVSIER